MKNNNYVDNDELQSELEAWRNSAEDPEDRMPSERLGQILMLMHEKILHHRNFNRYRQDLKDEMMSYSLFRILKCGLKSFKFESGCKPFSYFTRAIFLNYITCISKYYDRLNKHQQFIRGELMNLDTHGDPKLEWLVEHFGISE